MSYFKNVILKDENDNYISSHLQTNGDHHLGVDLTQSVYFDENNSSTTNLDTGNSYTFTGTGTSTLGVAGLQWSLKTDQNATVYVEESPDNTNWDISYEFDYIASKGGRGETIQATMAYWRIRVVLTVEVPTTYFRLSGVLCPIAMPLPSNLSEDGRLKSECHLTDMNDRHAMITGQNELCTSPIYRLVGTTFGEILDTNFWTSGGTGSVELNGEVKLRTGTSSSGSCHITSVRKARFVPGSANLLRGVAKLSTDPITGNTRRIGVYDDNNGFFFQISGTTFGVGYRKVGVDTIINSGSFNGDCGDTVAINTSAFNLAIEYGTSGARWYLDNKLLHNKTLKSEGEALVNKLEFPIYIETVNYGSTVDNGIDLFNTSIFRMGELVTDTISKHITAAATYNCKYSGGKLHRIIINDPTIGTSMTLYDSITGAGTVIAVINLGAKAVSPISVEYGINFSNGLTVVSTGTWDVTIVYE